LHLEKTVTEIPVMSATVSFVPLADTLPNATIDFSPSAPLPAGITYILTDDRNNSWNSADGFNGQVTASDYYSVAGPVIFTQTFYLNGVKITGDDSERTTEINVTNFGGIKFATLISDTGPVSLQVW